VRVALGHPQDFPADLVIVPGRRDDEPGPSVVVVKAPRFKPPSGPELALATTYRHAMQIATQRKAQSIVMPAALVLGPWPLDDVTRVAMTVLMSTPSPVRQVTIAVDTPAMLERWAEAIAREP
jgi:hypothetical protein